MKNEIDVIRDLASKFSQSNIDYMLTGSLAMNYYAQPRMTRDIDLVIALDAKGYDNNYVEKWTQELGLYDLWEECLDERHRA